MGGGLSSIKDIAIIWMMKIAARSKDGSLPVAMLGVSSWGSTDRTTSPGTSVLGR